ncbi:MAG: 50S ribosomal protein L11 methyltransferase, partial [Pseudomonadota bacterium]
RRRALGHRAPPMKTAPTAAEAPAPAGAPERLRALVAAQTRLRRPPLTPEFEIYSATEFEPIWSATEAELEALGLAPPFWAFAWPGGQALARHLLDHPASARGRRVLAIGAGAGLEALAAARAGAHRVVANDIDPVAGAAAAMNAAANALSIEHCGADLFAAPGAGLLEPTAADLVLLGDALYEATAAAAFAALAQGAAAAGAEVLIGEAGRGFLPELPVETVGRYRAPTLEALEDRAYRDVSVLRVIPPR